MPKTKESVFGKTPEIYDLLSNQSESIWLLSESILRTTSLKNELHELNPRLQFYTQSEALRKIAIKVIFDNDSEQEGYLQENQDWLLSLLGLIKDSTELAELNKDLKKIQNYDIFTFSKIKFYLNSVKSLLDALRLHQSTDKMINSIIDEFGNAQEDKIKIEEIILLLNLYRDQQVAEQKYDFIGLLEHADSILAEGKNQPLRLPQRIIFDQPSYFFNLEKSLLRQLTKFTEITLIQDPIISILSQQFTQATPQEIHEQLGNSKKFLVNQILFTRENNPKVTLLDLAPKNKNIEILSEIVLDNGNFETSEKYSFIKIKEFTEPLLECREIVRLIKHKTQVENIPLSEIQLIAINLKDYQPLLEEELLQQNVPFHIPKGKKIEETLLGDYLRCQLAWINNPSLNSLTNLTRHPLFSAKVSKLNFNISEEYSQFSEILNCNIKKVLELDFNPLINLANSLGIASFKREKWDKSLFNFILKSISQTLNATDKEKEIEYWNILYAVLWIQQQLLAIENLSLKNDVASQLRKNFLNQRHIFKRIHSNSNTQRYKYERDYACIALQKLREFLRRLPDDLNNISEITTETESQLNNISELFFNFLETNCQIKQSSDNILKVTELLDSRGHIDKIQILVGLTTANFPPLSHETKFTDSLNSISYKIKNEFGFLSPVHESLYLISNLFKHSRELILSFAQISNNKESQAAKFLLNLKEFCEFEFISNIETEIPNVEVNNKPLQSLLQRKANHFNSYDGVVGETYSCKQLNAVINDDNRGEISKFTASSLETLAECPHKFYFQRLLKVKNSETALNLTLASTTGDIVHQCLKEFFKNPTDAQLITASFESACSKMLSIANRVFKNSVYDFDQHPFWRQIKQNIIQGLEEHSNSAKNGHLKTALIYQKELIKTLPYKVEYYFGKSKFDDSDTSLQLTNEGESILINGIIDRIDIVDDGLIIWDYKTGSLSSQKEVNKGESLQIPIYALAAKQLFPEKEIHRGAIINLAKLNLSEKELSDKNKGALIEHLAITKINGKLTYAKEAIPPLLEATKANISKLDSLFRQGKFQQNLDTPPNVCKYCDYQSICKRDEIQLEIKENHKEPFRQENDNKQILESTLNKSVYKLLSSLSTEQEAACDIRENIVLIASAGSGKTTVLCRRIIKLILSGVPIEEIVGITFTEKAAEEIKLRIESSINSILHFNNFEDRTLTDAEAKLLHKALNSISLAPIGTIHSFAKLILSLNPIASNFSNTKTIISGAKQRELLNQAINKIIEEDIEKIISTLLEFGISYKTLLKEIAKVVTDQKTLQSLIESTEYSTTLISEIEKEKKLLRKNATEELSGFIKAAIAAIKESILPITKEAKHIPNYHRSLELLEQINTTENNPEIIDQLNAYNEFIKANRHFTSTKLSKGIYQDIKSTLNKAVKILEPTISDIRYDISNLQLSAAFIKICSDVNDYYSHLKDLNSVIDFSDLLIKCEKLLKDESESIFRQSLAHKFRHFLVDEFQDTDETQWSIIKIAAAKCLETKPQNNSILIVGDYQQAIYGFRGGNVFLFKKAAEELVNGSGKLLYLKDNYRSNDKLISFFNSFFSRLFAVDKLDTIAKDIDISVDHVSMNHKKLAPTDINAVSFVFVDKTEEEHNLGEAETVALQIKENLSSLNSTQKIAVLTRKSKDLTLIAKALNSHGIDYSITHSNSFYELDEILQFQNLLAYLTNTQDNLALVGVLRSTIFGLSDAEVLEYYLETGKRWRDTSSLKNQYFIVINNKLQAWRELAKYLPTSKLLQEIVTETNLEGIYHTAKEEEKFANIKTLIYRLSCAEINKNCDRNTLAAHKWITQQQFEASQSKDSSFNTSKVILTTIHGAKGLEFSTVILPFLNYNLSKQFDFNIGSFNSKTLNKNLSILSLKVEDEDNNFAKRESFTQNYLKKFSEAILRAEERRLFYVACTRAKDKLIFILNTTNKMDDKIAEIHENTETELYEECVESYHPVDWLIRLTDLRNR
ncbi:MAG: UvrD-helicase domain-containing protein [Proteobacteria bacterium]|nr:UvrD-helicase domain-containing protein [Pseudomonadota bacterium]